MGLNTYQVKKIPLAEVLARLGCEPHHRKGADVWYLSPFRQETEPSFHINTDKNTWYDFGMAGGNVLDFAMSYYRCGVSRALHELAHLDLAGKVAPSPPLPATPAPNPVTITSVQPLMHMALLLYLDKRCVDLETAKNYVQEIHYRRDGKTYFALAFASESGGWEMRNPYFKGVYGPKDITLLHPDAEGEVLVFEGFMDLLSFLTWKGKPAADAPVIVMNSAAMLEKAVVAIQRIGPKAVHLYLDRDVTGRRLMEDFQEQLQGVTVIDESGLYTHHKDFNDLLQTSPRKGQSR